MDKFGHMGIALTQPSTCTSILWQDPLWRKTADHARAYCGIISLRKLRRRRILHTIPRLYHTQVNLLRRAPIILVSRYLLCCPRTRQFLGPVLLCVPLCHTIRATHAELKSRNLFQACARRPTGLFWRLSPTRVLLAYIIITLHPHTPLIIIGAVDVAFNYHILFLS